jgi:hypothetical protein
MEEPINFIAVILFMKFIGTVILFISFLSTHGQKNLSDSLASSLAINFASDLYHKVTEGNSRLYNGIEYIDPYQRKLLDGDPYFFSDDWVDGDVFYDDQLYKNVALRYNIFSDKVVIEHSQIHTSIELIEEKIKYFIINEHLFIRLTPQEISGPLKEGFYNLLYAGESKVYVKRYKDIKEIIDQKSKTTQFLDRKKTYLFKDGQYLSISGKKSLINALVDKKNDVKRFISENRINYKKNPEPALVSIAKFYDSLDK